MPIGTGIIYNVGDLILSQVSGSGTSFLETKIAAATSSLIYFDSTAKINSASLNSITVGTASYVSGSTSIITNLTASNISASGTSSFGYVGIGTTSPNDLLHLRASSATAYDATSDNGQFGSGAGITIENRDETSQSFAQVNLQVSGNAGRALGRIVAIRTASATSDLAFVTENANTKAEKMRILSDGNVGIGTTSPAYKLDVNGTIALSGFPFADKSGNYNRIYEPAGNVAIYLGNASDQGNYYDNTTHYFRNRGGASNYVIINNYGNVGIGTSSPTAKLHIYNGSSHFEATSNGNAAIVAGLYALQIAPLSNRDSTAGSYYGGIAFNHLLNHNGVSTYNGAPQAWIGTRLQDTAGSERDYLVFATKPGTGTSGTGNDIPIERMCIDRDGLVGIGTTSPAYKLDVSGNLRISGSGSTVGTFKSSASSCFISLVDSSGDSVFLGNDDGDFLIQTPTSAYSTKLIVKDDGNVGIGTTSPTAKLVVMGDDVNNYAKSTVPTAIIADDDVEFLIGSTDNFAGEEITLRLGTVLSSYYTYGAYVKAIQGAGVDYYKLAFGTSNGAVATTKMTIDNVGNIGIGTTNPVAKLQVAGNVSGSSFTSSISNAVGFLGTSSWAQNVVSASYALTSSFATTAQTANALNTGNSYTISGLTNNSTLSQQGTLSMGSGYQILATTGTAPIPGISFVGDTNTGIYAPSADTLGFSISGSERVRIDSGGNVGIGTTSTAYKLEVSGSSRFTGTITGGNNIELIKADGPYVLVGEGTGVNQYGVMDWDATNNILRLATQPYAFGANGGQINLTTSGDVGIGTTAPAAKLDVTSAGTASTYTVSAVIQDATYPASGYPTLEFNGFIGGNGYRAGIGSIGGQQLAFYTPSTYGVAPTRRMTVDASGNLLIGKTDTLFTSAGTIIYPSSGLDVIRDGNPVLALNRLTSEGRIIDLYIATSLVGSICGLGGGGVSFNTSTTERMRITADGNVGIGTTSPDGNSKLHVRGYQVYLYNDLDTNNTFFYARNSGAGNAGIKMKQADGEWTIIANDRLRFMDDDAGVERLSILSDGNVGIGTTSPATTLDVNGTTFLRGNLNAGKTANLNTTTALNGTGGGNRGFDTSFTGASSTGFTGTDNTDQGFGYFAATIVSGRSYEVSATMVVTNGAPLSLRTSTGLNFATQTVEIIIDPPVSNTTYRFVATADATYIGLGFNRTSATMTVVVSNFSIKEVGSVLVASGDSVGIGTSPSNAKLHILGDWVSGHSTTKIQTITSFASGGTSGIGLYDSDGTRSGYLYANSTGTTVGSPIASPLIFETNGSERIRILSGGNVGIGTTSATTKLYVSGSVTALDGRFISNVTSGTDKYFLDCYGTSTNQIFALYENSNTAYLNSYSSMAFRANQNGGSGGYFVFTGANVGIGTTIPTINGGGLHVYGSDQKGIRISGNSSNSYSVEIGCDATKMSYIQTVGTADRGLQFYTGNASTVVMTLTGSNVGIGTISPAYSLDVRSTAVETVAQFRGGNDTNIIIGGNDAGRGGEQYITYQNADTATAAWMVGMDDGDDFRFAYGLAGEIDDAKTKVKIGQDGNVGIGTTAPAAKLEISGSSNSVLLNIKSAISGAILYVSGSGAVGIGTSNVGAYTLQVNGSFAATTKSFVIEHPTKAGKKLIYGSLESPYHGIRLTGRDTLVNGKCKIQLPDYIYKLILHDSVNIQLTGIKCNKTLYVDEINIPENYFTIAYDKAIFESYKDYDFFWDFTGIRTDVPELITEL